MKLPIVTIFKKHKYTVKCKCGHTMVNNDSGVIVECDEVHIVHCNKCCPGSSVIPSALYYCKGERIYT